MEHLLHSIRNLAPDSPQHRESGADGASRGARVPVSQHGVHRFPVGKRDGDPSSGLDRPIESLLLTVPLLFRLLVPATVIL